MITKVHASKILARTPGTIGARYNDTVDINRYIQNNDMPSVNVNYMVVYGLSK